MPKQVRLGTKYTGVFCVDLAGDDQTYYIRYKREGKAIEERAGRKRQGWTAAKANRLRNERLAGKSISNNQQRAQQRTKLIAEANRWTFKKLFAEYLSSRPDLKGRANDEYRFKNYLEQEFADRTPGELSHFDVERLKRRLVKRGLKPATVRHALEILRRLSNFGVKRNLCPGLPFTIEMPKVNNLKSEDLTPEQLEVLFQVLEEEPDVQVANLVRLALYTGMRRSELFRLKWDDLNFRRKQIIIREPKGGQDAKIPMNEMAEQVLTTHPDTGSDFVFPGRGGNQRTECKRPLTRIKARAGLPDDFRILHGLRHVYASMLASSGRVDLYTLQTLLTHKSPLMTQRYAHLRDEALMQASNVITDLVPSSSKVEVYRDS